MTRDPRDARNAPAALYEPNSDFDPVFDGLEPGTLDDAELASANVAGATLGHVAGATGQLKDRHLPINQTPDPDPDVSDLELARRALRSVLQDPQAPAAAKAGAARTLAEMAGALGRNSKPVADTSKPVGELSRDELERELKALSGL